MTSNSFSHSFDSVLEKHEKCEGLNKREKQSECGVRRHRFVIVSFGSVLCNPAFMRLAIRSLTGIAKGGRSSERIFVFSSTTYSCNQQGEAHIYRDQYWASKAALPAADPPLFSIDQPFPRTGKRRNNEPSPHHPRLGLALGVPWRGYHRPRLRPLGGASPFDIIPPRAAPWPSNLLLLSFSGMLQKLLLVMLRAPIQLQRSRRGALPRERAPAQALERC